MVGLRKAGVGVGSWRPAEPNGVGLSAFAGLFIRHAMIYLLSSSLLTSNRSRSGLLLLFTFEVRVRKIILINKNTGSSHEVDLQEINKFIFAIRNQRNTFINSCRHTQTPSISTHPPSRKEKRNLSPSKRSHNTSNHNAQPSTPKPQSQHIRTTSRLRRSARRRRRRLRRARRAVGRRSRGAAAGELRRFLRRRARGLLA